MSDFLKTSREVASLSGAAQRGQSSTQHDAYRRFLDLDPWAFSLVICKHGEKAVERFHRPLLYVMTGSWNLLLPLLDHPEFDSAVTRAIRSEFARMGINYRDPAEFPRIAAIRKVNVRISRRRGKSTMANDADFWTASRNPDMTIGIASKSDPVVYEEFIGPMKRLVEEDREYALFYADRIPDKTFDEDIKKDSLRLAGRSPQNSGTTIFGRGIKSQWPGRHFNRIRPDDIVGDGVGEATVNDARAWMANIHGISVDDIFGGTFRCHVGTVTGPDDDHSILMADPETFTVFVPVWIKGCEPTMENIMVDGELTLPEWGSIEMVRKMRADVLADKELGAPWWMQNFELTAHVDGSSVFSSSAFDTYTYRIEKDRDGHEWLTIPVFDPEGNPVLEESGEPKREWISMKSLWVTMGVDQAKSSKMTADEWAVGSVGWDRKGRAYALGCAFGRGYEYMMPAVLTAHDLWNRRTGGVRRIGLESDGFQELTTEIARRSPEYRRIAPKLEKVFTGREHKEARIRRFYASRMRTGNFFHPELPDENMHSLRGQALKYRPNRKAKDDRLDSIAIAVERGMTPPGEETEMAIRSLVRQQRIAAMDHYCGVPSWNFEGVVN